MKRRTSFELRYGMKKCNTTHRLALVYFSQESVWIEILDETEVGVDD